MTIDDSLNLVDRHFLDSGNCSYSIIVVISMQVYYQQN